MLIFELQLPPGSFAGDQSSNSRTKHLLSEATLEGGSQPRLIESEVVRRVLSLSPESRSGPNPSLETRDLSADIGIDIVVISGSGRLRAATLPNQDKYPLNHLALNSSSPSHQSLHLQLQSTTQYRSI
jgi:hypothetical protein